MTYVPQNINAESLYSFLLQQMAAESYFEKPMSVYDNNPQEVIDALTMGTNRKSYTSEDMPFNGGYPGLTRMTKAQAEEFVKKFKIIHQWSDNPCPDGSRPTQPGDAGYLALNGQQILANTGLSATLIKVGANEYTLAIRSTEMRPWDKGGDGERDKWATDFQSIGLKGFAFAQLDALEYYYQWLKTSGKLPANVDLNVTGYSLGGHLATVFTEIHRSDMKDGRTYAFNAPGRGEYSNGSLSQMLADFRRFMADPDAAGVPHAGDSEDEKTAYLKADAARDAQQAFDAKSIYGDPRSGEYEYNALENALDGLRRMFAASRSGAGLQPGLRANPRAACSHARRRTSA